MGRIWVRKSTLAGVVAESVTGFANESVGAISAEDFATASDFVAPDSALELGDTLIPAFVWAQPQKLRVEANAKTSATIRMLGCYSRSEWRGNH